MGILDWWREKREQDARTRKSIELARDEELIAAQVPELTSMNEVERMAFILEEIENWNKICTPIQAAKFEQDLLESNEVWEREGLIMPYWGNLWVLRSVQRDLGLDVPWVAPPARE